MTWRMRRTWRMRMSPLTRSDGRNGCTRATRCEAARGTSECRLSTTKKERLYARAALRGRARLRADGAQGAGLRVRRRRRRCLSSVVVVARARASPRPNPRRLAFFLDVSSRSRGGRDAAGGRVRPIARACVVRGVRRLGRAARPHTCPLPTTPASCRGTGAGGGCRDGWRWGRWRVAARYPVVIVVLPEVKGVTSV